MKPTVAIIGGGLAGIAAAMRLADAGYRPVLIETSRRLGGRATSFVDPRTGLVLDNCQHVLLGCCTNLLDLYERLGVLDLIEWHRTLYWTRGGGIVDEMTAGPWPAPLHLAGSMRRMRLLDAADKRSIRRAMWRLIRLGAAGRLAWRDRTFEAFLVDCGQTPNAIDRFWRTIVVSACNLDVDRVCAATAMQVFQEGFLANRWSYTMGLSRVPLRDLYDPAHEAIESAGGAVRFGVSARSIAYDGRRVTGVVTSDGIVEAAAVVAAVPSDRLDKLVSTAMRDADARLRALAETPVSPILAVHLRFDRPVMDLPHLALVEHDVHWLFDKGTDEDGRQHVHALVSAADAWMGRPEGEIIERVTADLHAVLPGARGITPCDGRVVKEKRATFAATPAFEPLRPRSAPGFVGLGGGGIENLFLAGDWCDVGWPATMEGAVRSGYEAAAALLDAHAAPGDPPARALVGDVPPGPLARLLGLGR